MAGLSKCLRKSGLSKHEAAILRGLNTENIEDGESAREAAINAVREYAESYLEQRKQYIEAIKKAGGDTAVLEQEQAAHEKEIAEIIGDDAKQAPVAETKAEAKEQPTESAPEPAEEAPVANTEDSGAELTANRRNRIKTGIKWDDIADKDVALRVSETNKQNIYPRPDYEKLVSDGMHPIIAHIVKQVYDAIPTKPELLRREEPSDQALRDYIDGVNIAMNGVMAWAQDNDSVRGWAGRYSETVAGAMDASGLRDITGHKSPFDFANEGGKLNNGGKLTRIGGRSFWSTANAGWRESRKAEKAVAEGWPAKQEAWQRSISIKETSGDTPRFVLVSKANPWRSIKGQQENGYATRDEAIEAARTLTKREGGLQQISDKGISVESAERIGKERRAEGENITSDKLRETFGFKGVNFGTWMKGNSAQAERQLHLNHAYDSFLDLADIIGVPPKAISLNGMLGVAIGAQGGGKAAAHFVPGVNEINLTRTSGAGSLAHEWGHAVDHYFAVQAGLDRSYEPFLTEHVSKSDAKSDGIRPEIMESFKGIVNAMNRREQTIEEYKAKRGEARERARKNVDGWLNAIKGDFAKVGVREKDFDQIADKLRASQDNQSTLESIKELRKMYRSKGRNYPETKFYSLQANVDHLVHLNQKTDADNTHVPQMVDTDYAKAAANLDGKKSKKYWSTNLEKFARAFDAFVSDKLESEAAKNTYLSHAGRSDNTVPQGAERQAINDAFDNLLSQIKTKETDTGTAMFSRTDVWYSQLARVVNGAKQNVAPASQWRAWIKNQPGVKSDEIEATGLFDWLDFQDGKVTKQQVQDFIAGNGVRVEEVELGAQNLNIEIVRDGKDNRYPFAMMVNGVEENRFISRASAEEEADLIRNDQGTRRLYKGFQGVDTKFSQYQLPGGTNYRELLLTLPAKDTIVREPSKSPMGWGNTGGGDAGFVERGNTGADFRSSHFDQPNILAHVRFNERVDAEGRRVLFLEEIQSDFGQSTKKQKDAIYAAVDTDFEGIISRMEKAGILEVNCD